jgi:signal transduction histidine kinase/CheY-like chemotaxis protein
MTLRSRVVLAALVPVTLVAITLTTLFLVRHLGDLDRALELHAQALARQAAASAEFSLFTGNREVLLALAQGVARTDDDISGVAILDHQEKIVAETGRLNREAWPTLAVHETRVNGARNATFVAPIEQRSLAVDDAYSGAEFAVAAGPRERLGHVVIEFTRERIIEEHIRLIAIGLLTALAGAGLGGFIALRIARSVTEPLLEATDVVTRIGHGDLAARMDAAKAGPLLDLATGLNAMAVRVGLTQGEFQQRIEAATAELVQQRDAAERATTAKSRFLAAASHDLRQPLHALGLFVSRLVKLPWKGEQRQLIDHVEESVSSLQDMLDRLLDISRLEAGGYRVDPVDFDLQPMLQRIARDFVPIAHENHISLRVRTSPIWIHSDPRLVERVVFNLLTNALRHTQQGGVLVASRRMGDQVRIQVWDTGRGIAPELQSEIFEEYVQIGNDERDQRKGLGLGLAICKRITSLLSAKIGLRSVPGRGSVFWIDLPIGAAATATAPAVQTEPITLHGSILVVDDDPLCLSSTADVISGWGGMVSVANSAESALDLCQNESMTYVLAVCDIRLPGEVDGIALGQRLRQLNPSMRIVLVSADVTPLVQAQARRAGFSLLKKPVAPARLRATLLSLLESKPMP